ncbi:hypothetical protein JWZ98_17365 [Methylomonas sp. EFPC1]|nr:MULTISPECIES: hypothetical protein [unclassified Methylomonas]QSB00430.1 hypothetical protein JWZ98_17365 [Methylomonas sp. EFPC1]
MNLNKGYALFGIALFGLTTAVRADQAILQYGGNDYGNQRLFDPNPAAFDDANI